jgi:hypothetical protein
MAEEVAQQMARRSNKTGPSALGCAPDFLPQKKKKRRVIIASSWAVFDSPWNQQTQVAKDLPAPRSRWDNGDTPGNCGPLGA